jgi:hypothetical protein
MPDPTLQREVRAHLQRYLLGSESLAEFHDWFAQATSALRRSGGADATIKTIELRLAEHKRGDWSEPQLRSRLLTLLPATTRGSASDTSAVSWTVPGLRIEKAGNIK